jgi:hypothetical protein
MCLLIILRGRSAAHPLVVAGNRDERTDRPAAPPGLWVGRARRVLSPRDRRAGGTWLGINDRGVVAGLTNVAGAPTAPDAPSRGHLVHLALDADDLEVGLAAVARAVADAPHSGFQLVVADARATVVLRQAAGPGSLQRIDWRDDVLVVSNEHAPGVLRPRGLSPALAPGLPIDRQLALLAGVLRDRGGDGHHAICKRGAEHGTVSSSLLAVPPDPARGLVWRYAAGAPDVAPYKEYGNLGRRLLPEPDDA